MVGGWSSADLLPGLAQQVLRDDPDDLIGPGLAFDETADLRNGNSAACVSPRHAGVTGTVENCVTWVFAALVTALGQAWIDFDVYMPECWAKDPQRRAKAGIPEKLAFATKPELAIAQVKRLMAAGVRAMWAAADEVYGRSGEFRAALRALSLAYVVIIPCDHRVALAKDTVIRADQAIPDAVFERRSCGNGTKGPRYGDWALLATAGPREFLLIRRFPDRDKNQYAFYLCWAPDGRPATRTYFITIAGRRWPVEVPFKTGKDALGWDQSQARTWNAICRHTALTALAQLRTAAIQAALAGADVLPAPRPPGRTPRPPSASPPPAPLTCRSTPEPRRCPPAEASPARPTSPRSGCPPPRPPASSASPATGKPASSASPASAFHLRWSAWRRRHQARARWHHYSTRLAALAT